MKTYFNYGDYYDDGHGHKEKIIMEKILIVIDMQNDFITGSLGSPLTQAVVPNVVEKIKNHGYNPVIVTLDTHRNDYLQATLEGKMLPVEHCIAGTPGHDIESSIYDVLPCGFFWEVFKNTFGAIEDLPEAIYCAIDEMAVESANEVEFEICGVCTDICVVSNALILRAAFPNARIVVDANCCAGTSVEAHEAALKVMESCQIEVKR